MTILYYLKPSPFTPPSGVPGSAWFTKKRHKKAYNKLLSEAEKIRRRQKREDDEILLILMNLYDREN